MSDCDIEDCPTCKIEAAIRSAYAEAPAELVMQITLMALREVIGNEIHIETVEVGHIDDHATLH